MQACLFLNIINLCSFKYWDSTDSQKGLYGSISQEAVGTMLMFLSFMLLEILVETRV